MIVLVECLIYTRVVLQPEILMNKKTAHTAIHVNVLMFIAESMVKFKSLA